MLGSVAVRLFDAADGAGERRGGIGVVEGGGRCWGCCGIAQGVHWDVEGGGGAGVFEIGPANGAGIA